MGCAARASKPITIFEDHLGRKKIPFFRVFFLNRGIFFTISGVRMANIEILGNFGKTDPCLGLYRDIFAENARENGTNF